MTMTDLNRSPTIAELIQRGALQLAAARPTAFIARVEAYDRTTQRATVQPALRQFWGDGSGDDGEGSWRDFSAPLINVPVQFPAWGDWVIHGELRAHSDSQEGDYVLCVVSARSLDEWLERGGIGVEPADVRVRMPEDCIALPAVWPDPSALPGSVARAGELVLSKRDGSTQIRIADGEVTITAGTVRLGSPGASDPVALSGQTDANLLGIVTELNKVIAFANTITPGTAIPITPQPSVAAGKVNAE